MKRPNLLYLLVVLQCAIGIGLAAVFVHLQQDLDEQRQTQAELYRGQIAISDDISNAHIDIMLAIPDQDEPSAPLDAVDSGPCQVTCSASLPFPQYKSKPIEASPWCQRFERQIQERTCTWNRRECGRDYTERRIVGGWEEISTIVCAEAKSEQ